MDHDARFRAMYDAFNARDIDGLLDGMAEDVDWPNAWEGGRVVGHAEVGDYWTRQWATIDPTVSPITIATRPEDGRIVVEVAQTVRDLGGALLAEGRVLHVYELRNGLVARMDVEEVG